MTNVKIKRVGGAQADGAKSMGLVKIDRESAKRLWTAKIPFVMVGNKVGPHAFFGRWHLAHMIDMRDPRYDDTTFDVMANGFGAYLEPELGNQTAFFVKATDLAEGSKQGGGGARTKADLARTKRPSPTAHAADCKFETKRGHDGRTWVSWPDQNGVFRWKHWSKARR